MRRVDLLDVSLNEASLPTNGITSSVGRAFATGSSSSLTGDELHRFPVGVAATPEAERLGLFVDLVDHGLGYLKEVHCSVNGLEERLMSRAQIAISTSRIQRRRFSPSLPEKRHASILTGFGLLDERSHLAST